MKNRVVFIFTVLTVIVSAITGCSSTPTKPENAEIISIELSDKEVHIGVGEEYELSAKVLPKEADKEDITCTTTNDSVIRLIDSNNNVVSNLKIEEKIRLFNIFLDRLIKHGIDKDLLNINILFEQVLDLENINLEKNINELFKKTMFLYSKPNIDIKEILSISDLVANKLDVKSDNNEYVKNELKKRLYYV